MPFVLGVEAGQHDSIGRDQHGADCRKKIRERIHIFDHGPNFRFLNLEFCDQFRPILPADPDRIQILSDLMHFLSGLTVEDQNEKTL